MSSNPGLASRFPKTLTFDDYDDDELFAIFALIAAQQGFDLADGVEDVVRSLIPNPHPAGFGNGRFMRNVFEEAVSIQAERLIDLDVLTPEAIRTLLPEDLPTEPPPDPPPPPGHVPLILRLAPGRALPVLSSFRARTADRFPAQRSSRAVLAWSSRQRPRAPLPTLAACPGLA